MCNLYREQVALRNLSGLLERKNSMIKKPANFLKSSPEDIFIDFSKREREKETERETYERETST